MEAAILLKTWARQRSIGQAGCVSGFQLTYISLYLPYISLYLAISPYISP